MIDLTDKDRAAMAMLAVRGAILPPNVPRPPREVYELADSMVQVIHVNMESFLLWYQLVK